MGYISNYSDVPKADTLKSSLQPYQSNDYILHMISSYVERFPHKKISI